MLETAAPRTNNRQGDLAESPVHKFIKL